MEYNKPKKIRGCSIDVLHFLNGTVYNQQSMNFIHALRPSRVRRVKKGKTLDSRLWRVSVYVDENNIIKKIEQEVEIGCD